MAEATLTDVIERLRAEGQLTRNTGTNSIKSVRSELSAIEKNTRILSEIQVLLNEIATIMGVQKSMMLESLNREERNRQLSRAQRDVVEPPSDNGTSPAIPSANDSNANLLLALGSLALIGKSFGKLAKVVKVAVASVGVSVGLVVGQFKAFGTFFPKLSASFTQSVTNIINSLRNTIAATIFVADQAIGRATTSFTQWITSLMNVAKSGVNRLGIIGKSLTGLVTNTVDVMRSIIKTFTDAFKLITDLLRTSNAITSRLSSIGSALSRIGTAIGAVARVVARLFAPIATIMTAFDTIRGAIDGFAEGGILGGIQGAIDGFFTSLITKPLDLVKDAVAWVVGKLGFDETSEAIKSFSFTELFTDITGAIFDTIKSAIDWVKTLFTDPTEALSQMWAGYMGYLASVVDILYAPVNIAIDWITKKFGWRDEDAPAFSIQDIILEWVDGVTEWVKNIFSFLPSASYIKNKLTSFLPDFMRSGSNAESDPASELREQVRSLEQQRTEMVRAAEMNMMSTGVMQNVDTSYYDRQIADLNTQIASFRTGSKGFMDFGMGTPAMLHGIEAVVPRNTTAGQFLDANFTDNWEPIMKRIAGIESSAISQASSQPIIVTNAPTIAPVNNNIRGATNISNQRISGVSTSNGSGLGRFAN
jgi:hypothetical protein